MMWKFIVEKEDLTQRRKEECEPNKLPHFLRAFAPLR
ncbi:hypothetical protein I41_17610 [Lacipirellula limnantheis]|uniref:Uncharacterized protein n=1 Tax=Lacipirellula limnantheis TaxID=2528024 RepID=A0A517TW30_9BACT|nr:hypothetical protein I41_17610 [Lacipirellula limnantheis]